MAADSTSQTFHPTRTLQVRTTRVCNQLDECARHLRSKGYQQVQLVASYPSYMTGLIFHKYEERPEEHRVYSCLPEINPHDPNALGIISSQNKRIAFVPQIVSAHLVSAHPAIQTGAAIVVAFCTGGCTQKSAQCIYNVYQITAPSQIPNPAMFQQFHPTPAYSPVPVSVTLPASMTVQQQQQPQQQQSYGRPAYSSGATCTVCCGPANRCIVPCRHYACCLTCAPTLYNQACPTCRQTVTGTSSF